MRTIEQTGQFRRDYKREAKGPHRQTLQSDFVTIVATLANDQPLAEKHHDPGTGRTTGIATSGRTWS